MSTFMKFKCIQLTVSYLKTQKGIKHTAKIYLTNIT